MKINELKAQRARAGLTQQEVALKLGVNTTTYTKKENGINPFTLEEIKKLKKIFNLSDSQVVNIFLN